MPPAACPQVMAELPPLGQELPLRWVPVEDTPPVPGITWKTLTVQQNSAPHSEYVGAQQCLGAQGCLWHWVLSGAPPRCRSPDLRGPAAEPNRRHHSAPPHCVSPR